MSLAAEAPKRTPSLAVPSLAVVAEPAPQPVVQTAPKPAPRKTARKRHQPDDEGFFGSNGRQDFGMFREPSFGSREPSWRDSWASGAFQQREARPRRNASRNDNNFWHFR